VETDAVLTLLQDVAEEVITPRFRSLADHQIHEKGPGDLVTVADREAESRITDVLQRAYPDALVLGEEATAADGSLMARFAAADHAFTFKNGIKELARQHGLMASFMTKPYADQSACGCHLHESLLDRETGANAFAADDTTPGRLSKVGRWWVGGQLAHLPALTAFFAPTVNCSKRFKQWSFAPVNATWALENRSVAIRVKGLPGERLHIENRVPCGASNPYLVGAAAVAAGLDGIRNRIEPPPALDGVAYGVDGPAAIPTRLESALDELEKDTTLRELLGDELIATFLAVKRHEVAKAAEHVPDYGAADWPDRVDEFETDELFEFL